jgi:hypothetical protein
LDGYNMSTKSKCTRSASINTNNCQQYYATTRQNIIYYELAGKTYVTPLEIQNGSLICPNGYGLKSIEFMFEFDSYFFYIYDQYQYKISKIFNCCKVDVALKYYLDISFQTVNFRYSRDPFYYLQEVTKEVNENEVYLGYDISYVNTSGSTYYPFGYYSLKLLVGVLK